MNGHDAASGDDATVASKRFLLIDDHPLFREALASALRASFRGADIAEAGSIETGRKALADVAEVDLILLDLTLQRFDGFEGLIGLRKDFPLVPVLIVSGLEEPGLVHEALCLGASGFVPKASGKATIAHAVEAVLSGAISGPEQLAAPGSKARPRPGGQNLSHRLSTLTPAQTRVLMMIRRGMLNREIAAELAIGESTVKAHVSEIIRKLGVISRTQVVIETARHDLETAHMARG